MHQDGCARGTGEVMPVIPQEAAVEPVVVDEQVGAVPEIAAEEVAFFF